MQYLRKAGGDVVETSSAKAVMRLGLLRLSSDIPVYILKDNGRRSTSTATHPSRLRNHPQGTDGESRHTDCAPQRPHLHASSPRSETNLTGTHATLISDIRPRDGHTALASPVCFASPPRTNKVPAASTPSPW